ncbi:MAG: DUF21 domain-containing protein [Deltaproteobacteria bacterium]|nr:DUF21 domain-containing protein [Deltaproteobacteria bacterium]
MDWLVLGAALIELLALNGFFVLAEFAIVRVRPSRVAELAAGGDARAVSLATIQKHLDEYLSVCQVGITLASVALGMVGKKATDVILGQGGHSTLRWVVALGISYVVVSGSHILLGELVPKSVAIRMSDRAALASAAWLRFFRSLFFPVLWLLTTLANAILRLFGMGTLASEEHHSEEELRIILEDSQERGVMSFRRLLFLENVFDFGELTAKDAMRPRAQARCLAADAPWAQNLETILATRLSRYPLIDQDPERPTQFVHLKDLVLRGDQAPNLRALARPLLTTNESTSLEQLLSEMQRRRHLAIVRDAEGRWTGLVSFEDVLEELVGTIRDEFEEEEPVRLADALSAAAVHLDVDAETPIDALRKALSAMPANALPLPADQIVSAVAARERLVGTYLGQGIAMPHARLTGLSRPFLMLLRSPKGVVCAGTKERGHLLFVLLTPAGQPRIHQRLQSIIATLLHESGYVKERLLSAVTAEEVLEVIRTGEQTALD